MADYRQTALTIRSYLAAMDRAPTLEIADAARGYADEAAEANARLRRCIDYLRHGLRCEAIELAEEQPPLLEMVAALELQRPDDWEQACNAYGWPRPQRLMLDAAREVNEAYNQMQPLTDLLQRHRTLALRRGPLPERLAVLWELSQKDKRAGFWQSDARALESARLSELPAAASTATRDGDLSQIDQLLDEVKDKRWGLPIPDDLRASLQTASTVAHRRTALGRLRALAPEVESAVNAGNAADARRVLETWCAVVAKAQITLPSELRQLIRPLNVLVDADDEHRENQKRFRAACTQLAAALSDQMDPNALKELYHASAAFGEPVPDRLEREYRGRIAAWESARRQEAHRSLLLTVLLLGAIAAALATLLVVILRSGH